MCTFSPSAILFAVLFALGLMAVPAQAQLARTFVSAASGNDANDCNRLTPCRTFQRAHDNTLAAGEITVLDPGGYGAVAITKGISIVNDGVGEAGALVSGGTAGITIDAGNFAGAHVSLRGLTVKGIGFGGGNGIVFNSGLSLTIENCVIRNLDGGFTGDGIVFQPNGASRLAVSNTLIADNQSRGIAVVPIGANFVRTTFNRVAMYHNAYGIFASGLGGTGVIHAVVADSIAAGNSLVGFFARTNPGSADTNIMVVRSVAADNGTGLSVDGTGAVLRIGQSAVTGNAASWTNPSALGLLVSYGDNNINGNGDGDPAPIPIVTK
jgi:hypothetical protein